MVAGVREGLGRHPVALAPEGQCQVVRGEDRLLLRRAGGLGQWARLLQKSGELAEVAAEVERGHALQGEGYDCGMCGRPHLHITRAVLKFWRYQDVNLACWELQKELKARQVQLSVAIAEADAKHGGFDDSLAEVCPAFVEASDQAIVAATVFAAPRLPGSALAAGKRRFGKRRSRDEAGRGSLRCAWGVPAHTMKRVLS